MSLLIFSYRKQEIIRRKNEISFKLMNLTKKLMDLQSYSTSVSDGTVSMSELIQAPASMFNRMSIFAMGSNNASIEQTNMKFSQLATSGMLAQMMSSVPQEQQAAYQQMVKQNLYIQSREAFGKREEKLLNMENLKIDQEKAKLETQLKMLEAEESKVSEQEDKAAKDSAPKYGGS